MTDGPDNYVHPLVWVWDHAPVPDAELLPALHVLGNHASEDGMAFQPPIGDLAWAIRKSTEQAQSDLDRLADLGLIELADHPAGFMWRLALHMDRGPQPGKPTRTSVTVERAIPPAKQKRAVPQTLYRFFDAAGDLLYVGITNSLPYRMQNHNENQPWWTEVASIATEPFPDRKSVEAAELRAIRTEHPRYNKMGVSRDPSPAASA